MRNIITLLVALAFALPVAGATDAPSEEAEAGIHLVHDLGDNHTAWVGQPYSFGYVLLDAEGMTRVHQQGCIVVEQNDVVLYETTADSSHDYNALNTFQFTFERAGPFTVWVAIPDGQCGDGVQFEDQIEGVAKRVPAEQRMGMSTAFSIGSSGHSYDIELEVFDVENGSFDGLEGVVEVRRPDDGWLVLRAPLAGWGEESVLRFCFQFPDEGEWDVRFIIYDSQDPPRFGPSSATTTIEVPASIVTPGPGAAGACAEAFFETCEASQGTASDAGALRTAVDPQASSSPFSRFVLNALAVDEATASPGGDAAYTAWVRPASGCEMPVFYSPAMSSMGPLLDLVLHWPDPGQYVFEAEGTIMTTPTDPSQAPANHTKQEVLVGSLAFTVGEVLPIHGIPMPGTVGSVIVTADGLDAFSAGEPNTVTFFAADPSGTAAAHSEIDFQILRTEWGPPLVQNKLHTHASGSFEFSYTFAEPGDYVLVVDPVTIHGEATPDYYYGELGGELVVPFSVADGPGLVDNVTEDEEDAELEGDSAIPSVGFMAFVVAAGVGLVLVRRR